MHNSYPMKTETSFADWLQQTLDERGMNQLDLAKVAEVGSGSISDVISGRRKVGRNLATAIAKGLKLPPEFVFQKAGFLPPDKEHSDEINQILHEIEGMSKEEQEEILSYIRWRNNRRKE
jgi:transcriptional regulator with XRE-family HTH domain